MGISFKVNAQRGKVAQGERVALNMNHVLNAVAGVDGWAEEEDGYKLLFGPFSFHMDFIWITR